MWERNITPKQKADNIKVGSIVYTDNFRHTGFAKVKAITEDDKLIVEYDDGGIDLLNYYDLDRPPREMRVDAR